MLKAAGHGIEQLASRWGTHRLGQALVWTLPTVMIPAIRYTQDEPEHRGQLFVRDFSTYSIGAGLFGIGSWLTARLLKNSAMPTATRHITALLAGLSLNILFAGLGAVKLSSLYDCSGNEPKQNPPPRFAFGAGEVRKPSLFNAFIR